MSYDVAVCTPPVSPNDQRAWEELEQLIDSEGAVPSVFMDYYEQLTAKYPCICSLPVEDVDDGVWNAGPLWDNFGHRVAVLGVVFSRIEEVYPFLVQTANRLGLTVFDWAGPTIHRP
jgi:hypothetical protein